MTEVLLPYQPFHPHRYVQAYPGTVIQVPCTSEGCSSGDEFSMGGGRVCHTCYGHGWLPFLVEKVESPEDASARVRVDGRWFLFRVFRVTGEYQKHEVVSKVRHVFRYAPVPITENQFDPDVFFRFEEQTDHGSDDHREDDGEAVVAPEPLDRIDLKGTYREGDGR